MLEAQKKLQEAGHEGFVPPDTADCLENPELNTDEEHCFKTDIMRACMDIQEKSDAILALNYPRNGIEGYVGAHTLIELGLAYYLKQKIFLLFPVPSKEEVRSSVEIMHMKPVILNGDLDNIK